MAMFSNQTPKSQDMAQAQRLSPDGRVKPQANGGRKILVLSKIGMTNSLVTSCNESAGKPEVRGCAFTETKRSYPQRRRQHDAEAICRMVENKRPQERYRTLLR